MLKFLIRAFFAPLYSRILGLIAYGPWGKFHQLLIWGFKRLYKIDWPATEKFKNLGGFFLRDIPYKLGGAPLVSPAEGKCFEGPLAVDSSNFVSAKGIDYSWSSFQELKDTRFSTYWNIYLAPANYHWVHSPAGGKGLEAIRISGAKYPVNAFGRKLCPKLFAENERLVFRFTSAELGRVAVICIGAMGVSALHSTLGHVPYGSWAKLRDEVQKGDRLLAFRLGSTVLLLTEKPPTFARPISMLKVGDDLA